MHQVYDGSAYGAPDRDTDQWLDPWGEIAEPPADLVRLLPAADRRVAPDRETLAKALRAADAAWSQPVNSDHAEAFYLNRADALLASGVLGIPAEMEALRATIRRQEQTIESYENHPIGIPADQRVIQREVAICSADGLPDWQHAPAVDEDTDGHGPWYSLDTWERMQNLTAVQRTADRETIAAAMREHYLDPKRMIACICGNWVGDDMNPDDWDAHLADAVLAVLVPADLIRADVWDAVMETAVTTITNRKGTYEASIDLLAIPNPYRTTGATS